MKVTRNNQVDVAETIKVNAKQYLHNHGQDIADKIEWFFETQAGSRPSSR